MSGGLVVFLGPTLAADEARALASCTVLPPAAQGDVWRVLERQPQVILLVDGIFESLPSVWHQELLAALDAGVQVLGASSMGALRAAELHSFGMQGVGAIFEAYREGHLVDDAEVALLHADGEHQWRPLTVPLVNVRHAVAVAVRKKVLSDVEGTQLVAAAASLHYQQRRWPDVWRVSGLGGEVRARWETFAAAGLPDLKAEDARRALTLAARLLQRPSPAREGTPIRRFGSAVRHRRLAQAGELGVERDPDWEAAVPMLAAWARSLALRAAPDRVEELLVELVEQRSPPVNRRGRGGRQPGPQALPGPDAAQLRALCEDRALAEQVLELGPRWLPDAPGLREGMALMARWPR